jgi:pyrimidine operon attenuation protein/uracil phosphoribosyltransferase
LAVLIDRHGHRQVPIQADYVARKIDTRTNQRVDVQWSEDGGDDVVYLDAYELGSTSPVGH